MSCIVQAHAKSLLTLLCITSFMNASCFSGRTRTNIWKTVKKKNDRQPLAFVLSFVASGFCFPFNFFS